MYFSVGKKAQEWGHGTRLCSGTVLDLHGGPEGNHETLVK
jgi:hypothetical protein